MRKRLIGQAATNLIRNLIRHPRWRWFVVLGSLFYLVSPLDISPDFVPLVGWVDDGLLATLVVSEVSQFLLDNRRNSSRKTAAAAQSPQAAAKQAANESVIDVTAVPVS